MLIRAIKVYFTKKKQRKRLRKYINHEILEVLATICMYLEKDGRLTGNPSARMMRLHFDTLKELSNLVRKDLEDEG